MPWLFETPPSPFGKKTLCGTPVNWAHPLTSGLVLCWGLTEGSGSYLVESAWGGSSFAMRWGADTAIGTGVNIPFWTYGEHTLALQLAGTNLQTIAPVHSGGAGRMRPFVDPRKGLSIEFWGKPTGDPTHSFGMIGMEAVVSGQFMRFSLIGPTIDFRLSGGPTAGFIQSPTYASFAAMGNHFVATVTQKGEAKIYMNGRQVSTGYISYLTDQFNAITIAGDRNVLHDRFAGFFYKASVYNAVLGPGAVLQLALNPMAVFGVDYPAAIGEPAPPTPPAPPGDGQHGEIPICSML